jgi:hypothetical protein
MRRAFRKARSSRRSSSHRPSFSRMPSKARISSTLPPAVVSRARARNRAWSIRASTTPTSKSLRIGWRSGIRPSVPPSSPAAWRRFRRRSLPFSGRAIRFCTVGRSMALKLCSSPHTARDKIQHLPRRICNPLRGYMAETISTLHQVRYAEAVSRFAKASRMNAGSGAANFAHEAPESDACISAIHLSCACPSPRPNIKLETP